MGFICWLSGHKFKVKSTATIKIEPYGVLDIVTKRCERCGKEETTVNFGLSIPDIVEDSPVDIETTDTIVVPEEPKAKATTKKTAKVKPVDLVTA